jgi:hypothetical protein
MLKAELAARQVRVVALDLPTSWMMATANADAFTARMFEAINGRTSRIAADRPRAKPGRGRMVAIRAVRRTPSATPAWPTCSRGMSWSQIQAANGCSRATVAKIAKRAA